MKTRKIHLCLLLQSIFITTLIIFTLSDKVFAKGAITPTEVYHLTESIDKTLIQINELQGELNKKRISRNIKPRNVYEKALTVLDEFNTLHPNAVDVTRMDQAYNLKADEAQPEDVFNLINLMKQYLEKQGHYLEAAEEREVRTPSDVFQMLRQVSMHHFEIAKKTNIKTDWATAGRVYEGVVMKLMPVLESIADDAEIKFSPYPFPRQAVTGIIPRYVYRLLSQVYNNISEYYKRKGRFDLVRLETVNDCDDLSPADVYDLLQIISAEFKANTGNKMIRQETLTKYNMWKGAKQQVVPGDVFRIIQYNLILSKRIMEEGK